MQRFAKEAGVPTVPGIEKGLTSAKDAEEWAEQLRLASLLSSLLLFCVPFRNVSLDRVGYPIMLKALAGGGGRGMRIVRAKEDMKELFERASSEAKSAFGDGSMFIEKYLENPRHIEVQIIADRTGAVS